MTSSQTPFKRKLIYFVFFFPDCRDHEYEPISAPSGDSKTVGVDSQESKVPIVQLEELVENDDDAGSITSAERKFLRIPMDEELVVPEDGQSEDAAMSEGDINVDDR